MLCPVCGNEAAPGDGGCRFCGASFDKLPVNQSPSELHRVVNLEQGRPLVETALRRMENELRRARTENLRVLTLIHGYGSTGRGGRIRHECRKVLDHLVEQKQINSFIAGETFKKRTGAGRALLKRYGQLEQSCRSDFGNPGVTIVVL
jgi:hypothetical protein